MMDRDDVDRILQYHSAMIGSDGMRRMTNFWAPFPRSGPLFQRSRAFPAGGEAVHRMTGLTAGKFGLDRRGTSSRRAPMPISSYFGPRDGS